MLYFVSMIPKNGLRFSKKIVLTLGSDHGVA
jgi:hypothetical protein